MLLAVAYFVGMTYIHSDLYMYANGVQSEGSFILCLHLRFSRL